VALTHPCYKGGTALSYLYLTKGSTYGHSKADHDRHVDKGAGHPAQGDPRLRQWAAGTQLIVEDTADGVLLKSAPIFPESDLKDVFGVLHHTGPALSIEAMGAAIASEAERRAGD